MHKDTDASLPSDATDAVATAVLGNGQCPQSIQDPSGLTTSMRQGKQIFMERIGKNCRAIALLLLYL